MRLSHECHLKTANECVFGEVSVPEETGCSRVTTSRHDSGLIIAADAAIYNRSDIASALGLTASQADQMEDSRFLLEAYRRWGFSFPTHIMGDFAFAIWDPSRRSLLLGRDHLGVRPLYYAQNGQEVRFASEIKGLTASAVLEAELDETGLAALASGTGGSAWSGDPRTLYRGVMSVPPAAVLELCENGTTEHAYWSPVPRSDLSGRADDDILEEFRALMADAVISRIPADGPVLSLLSGGLDSSGIVAMASDRLKDSSRPIETFSSVPEERGAEHNGDVPYINTFERFSNVRLNALPVRGAGPFDDLEGLIERYESPLAPRAHYLYGAFTDAAIERGGRVVLDGVGGELGPTFHGTGYFPELLLHGRLTTLVREMRAKRERTGRSAPSLIRHDLVRPFLRAPGLPSSGSWQRILRKDFIDRHAPEAEPVRAMRQLDLQKAHLKVVQAGMKSSRVAGFRGYERVRYRFPYYDIRLLEFCLGVPSRLKVRDGYSRYLIRKGLDGILPPEIQWRTTKAPFAPDFQLRYNRQRGIAAALLDDVKADDPIRDIVDVEALRRFAHMEHSEPRLINEAAFESVSAVISGVYAIQFLRQFSAFKN